MVGLRDVCTFLLKPNFKVSLLKTLNFLFLLQCKLWKAASTLLIVFIYVVNVKRTFVISYSPS